MRKMILIALVANFINLVPLKADIVNEKILICGIAQNIQKSIPNLISFSEALGVFFDDYRVIIYEDSSTDQTKQLLKDWRECNPKVIIKLDDIPLGDPRKASPMGEWFGRGFRTFRYARARNAVLDIVRATELDDFKYVVMMDLDFYEWDLENILDTINNQEYEWDAVFANGRYDLFAFRHKEFPIGYELIGDPFWKNNIDTLSNQTANSQLFNRDGPWFPVYSAFGGLGIYKREAIIGSQYSGVVTKSLETQIVKWLFNASKGAPLLELYKHLCSTAQIVDIHTSYLENRFLHPEQIGVRLFNEWGLGKVSWFSVGKGKTLPSTCEHVTLHADMACNGFDRLYVNPRICMNHPPG